MTSPTRHRSVVAVMVTHNGERHLDAQLRSMALQTRLLDRVVVLDDDSADGTLDILDANDHRLPLTVHRIRRPRSASEPTLSRIGRNFRDALRLAAPAADDLVLFADQDDVWDRERVARQASRTVTADVTAATATCIDAAGKETGALLDDLYPRPQDWSRMGSSARVRAALTAPLATGAAMAADGGFLARVPEVPAGWLHDRWYSLCAAVQEGLDLDPRAVIEYRIHDTQALGASGAGRAAALGRVAAWARRPVSIARRIDEIGRLGQLTDDPGVRADLRRSAVARTMLRRVLASAA